MRRFFAVALVLLAACGQAESAPDVVIKDVEQQHVEYVPLSIQDGVRAVLSTTTTTAPPTTTSTIQPVPGTAPSVDSQQTATQAVSGDCTRWWRGKCWDINSCGGNLDTCLTRIGSCESTGELGNPINYTARNPESSASGGWQFLIKTWRSYGDLRWPTAADAPPDVQRAAAARLFNARGSQPWFPSDYCWRTQ